MPRCILGERDHQMLMFLWAFKIATTNVLARRYFAKSSLWSAYIRLYRLSRAGFIKSHYFEDGRQHFWCLDDLGYEIIRGWLPPLVQDGYKSENVRHDFLVLVAHMGSWIEAIPNEVVLFTEQQLRRIDPAFYPEAIPKSKGHRPDGYWAINSGSKKHLIALEVERSQKTLVNYDSVARFYYKDAYVDQVIWIVDRMGQARQMQTRFEKAVAEHADIHSFVLLKDLKRLVWQSPIVLGKDRSQTIQKVLDNLAITTRKQVIDFDFFDTRKKPIESAANQNQNAALSFN